MYKVYYIALSFLTLVSSSSLANEVRVFGNEYKPPKIYVEDGKAKGILPEILAAIVKESDLSLPLELLPWKRAYKEASVARGAIIGLSKTKERLKIFDYSDVVYYDELLLLGTKNNVFPFENIADLNNKRIRIQRGSKYGDAFEKSKNRNFIIEEDSNAVYRLKKLLRNRIDVAIVSGPGMTGALKIIENDPELSSRRNEFYLYPVPFKKDPNYLGISKSLNMLPLISKFNLALKKVKDRGLIDQITKKHATSLPPHIVFGIIGFAPWGIQKDNLTTGIFWDQSLKILKETGFTGEPSYATYPRMIKQLREGSIDCAIFTKNSSESEYFHFVSYMFDLNVTVISRTGISINKYEDFLSNKKIKIVGFPNGGSNYFPKLYNNPNVKKHIVPTQKQGPAMIKRGRIDAFIGIEKTLIYEVNKQGLIDNINFTEFNVNTLPVWLQCSKKSYITQKDLDSLKIAVENLKSRNAFQQIIKHWLPI
jgi:polar amino acid transport system substrate-binding protein